MEQGVDSTAPEATWGRGLSHPGAGRRSIHDRTQCVKSSKVRKTPNNEPEVAEEMREKPVLTRDMELPLPLFRTL